MEPNQGEYEIDRLLRQSMHTPVPTLPPDFEQRVMHGVRRSTQPLDKYRQMLLNGYGIVSIVVSVVVMRGVGVGWGTVTGMIAAPLALVALARSAWRATHHNSANLG
jgi:hypothetical protein